MRINISVPEDAPRKIDRYAGRQGYTRSDFLLNAATERMRVQAPARVSAGKHRTERKKSGGGKKK